MHLCFPSSAQEPGQLLESFAGYSRKTFHLTHLHTPLIFGRMEISIIFCLKLKKCGEVFAHGSLVSSRDYFRTLLLRDTHIKNMSLAIGSNGEGVIRNGENPRSSSLSFPLRFLAISCSCIRVS